MDYFNLKLHKTTLYSEILAGLTTFISFAYILVLNPIILGEAGMDTHGVFAATALSIIITTTISALYTRLPLVYAPSMGLNYFFVILAIVQFQGDWKMALLATYLSGILFLLCVKYKLYEKILQTIPKSLFNSIVAGIGVGLVRTGLMSCGILQKASNGYYNIGSVYTIEFLYTLLSLIIILICTQSKKKNILIKGLVVVVCLAVIFAYIQDSIKLGSSLVDFIAKHLDFRWEMSRVTKVAFQFPKLGDIFSSFSRFFQLCIVVFVMAVSNFVTANSTLTSSTEILHKRDGSYDEHSFYRCMKMNGIGSIISACAGCTPITISAESTVGINNGGKTGLSALVTSGATLIALLLGPIFYSMSVFVVAPILIWIGIILIRLISYRMDCDPIENLTSIVVIVYLGLTFQIVNAVLYGILFYIIMEILAGKIQLLNRSMIFWIICSITYIVMNCM